MKPTERSATSTSTPKAGLRSMPSGLLPGKGSGALSAHADRRSSSRHVLATLAGLATVLGALAVAAAPALAAGPEAPKAEPATGVFAATAVLHGVVNPNITAPVEPGTYEFLYKATKTVSKTECESADANKAPTSPGMYFGNEPEPESESLSGLSANTEYIACLSATDAGGTTVSAPVSFKTKVAVAPEAPSTEAPVEVKDDAAILDGVVNPSITEPVEPGTYEFLYKATATATQAECESAGASKAPATPGAYAGAGPEPFSEALPGLTQDTEYVVCLAATNTGGRTVGPAVAFKTGPPEAPTTGNVEPVTGTTATLHGVLNPSHAGEAGTYDFVYKQSESNECQGEDETATAAKTATGSEKEAVPAETVSGLVPATDYAVCLVAKNHAEEAAVGAPVSFTTTAVGQENSPVVTADEAEISAEIGTDNSETTYHAQYGANSAEESATVEATVAAAGAPVTVEVRIPGLKAATIYHFHFVANNGHGPAAGEERTFTTPAGPSGAPKEVCANAQLRAEQPYGPTLPDCRAYEMVSPLDTNGQDATEPFVASPPRAAVAGGAVTYSSRGSFDDPTGATLENQYVSRRESNGWTTQAITPLRDPIKVESRAAYAAALFSPELTAAIAASNDPLTGVGSAGEFQLFHVDLETGAYEDVGPQEEGIPMGASNDLTHVVFQQPPNTPDSFIQEWVNGTVTPVNVTNAGGEIPASVGAVPHSSSEEDMWHAVSSDGSRVYFTSKQSEAEAGTSQLYVRVNAEQPQSPMSGERCEVLSDACTIEVSASQRGAADSHGVQPARYWGASADGSKVFFTSNLELTKGAYTDPGENSPNLYEYELSNEPGKTPGRLTDLTVDKAGNGAAVQGVAQISEEGSYAYFVADGVLTQGSNAEGQEPVAGQPNLYVVHEGGALEFITTLAEGDEPVWRFGAAAGESGPELNSAVVSPGGNYLAFLSEKSLTGYDNHEAATGDCDHEKDNIKVMNGRETEGRCNELFLYDAVAAKLVCASCNPTGALPTGPPSFGSLLDRKPFDQHRSRNLLEDGTLFFDSFDGLVPHASAGIQNVYEYENGQVRAISDPSGGQESFFLDASASGGDVFFATATRLLPEDMSDNVVVWDARAGGGFPAVAAPPSCDNGDSCKPPPSSQPSIYGAPASATFSGAGNPGGGSNPSPAPAVKTKALTKAQRLAAALKSCRNMRAKKKRARCEKQARQKYGATKTKAKAKKSSNDRRASR